MAGHLIYAQLVGVFTMPNGHGLRKCFTVTQHPAAVHQQEKLGPPYSSATVCVKYVILKLFAAWFLFFQVEN